MNVSLTLTAPLTEWAKTQTNLEEAILDVLEAHLATIDSPTIRAAKLLTRNALKMPSDVEFEIPQVIGRADWEKLTRSERLSLGKEIKRTPEAFGLIFLRKSASNHAIYKRLAS